MVFDNIFEPHNWALVPFHFWSLVVFVFGCMIGSFLNVCIYRMPLDLSVVTPPSHCPHCKYAIPFYLNVPLLTWLSLRGRCKNCGAPISARYFAVELLTGLVIGVAAVAFVVGGIGIMNMMLVSVTERMHEVGIRKAIGATTRQIMMQFITEAAILSITGGVVAIAIAYAVEGLLALFTGPVLVITWQAALFAFLPSVVVGIIFGSAPALKAARKDPIAALRNE